MVHVQNEHKQEQQVSEGATARPVRVSQPKINTVLSSMLTRNLSKEKHDSVDDTMLKLLVSKALPVSLVTNTVMRQLLYQLEPRYKVPSKQGVNDMLEQKFADMKVKLNRELSSLPEPPAITHDGWTSNSTQNYDTVTFHMITSDWELRHAVLGTVKVQGQHTGENIAESIKTTVDEWGIGMPAAVTTDNAANEQKAIRLLGFQQFGCFGH